MTSQNIGIFSTETLVRQARRATMDRSYRYLRILFGIRDKNGNSFHNLKKKDIE